MICVATGEVHREVIPVGIKQPSISSIDGTIRFQTLIIASGGQRAQELEHQEGRIA